MVAEGRRRRAHLILRAEDLYVREIRCFSRARVVECYCFFAGQCQQAKECVRDLIITLLDQLIRGEIWDILTLLLPVKDAIRTVRWRARARLDHS